MSGINRVMVVGRLGKDPELRYLPSGEAVTNLTVATSEQWTDKASGDKKEQTEWHRVALFGKPAEIAGQYLMKGSLAGFEGKLQTRKWTDKDGNDRYTTEVRCERLHLLEKKRDNAGASEQQSGGAGAQRPATQAAPASRGFDDLDDDVPF